MNTIEKIPGKSWYAKLILLLACSGLPLWAMAADLDSWCEHRLINPIRQRELFREFQSMIEAADEDRPARVNRSATALAALKFGVDSEIKDLTLSLEQSRITRSNVILWVKSEGRTIFKSLMHLPPLYAWKYFDEMSEPEISLPLSQSSWSELSVGTVLEAGFQMRKYIEIRRQPRGKLTITLGVDVDCDMLPTYTNAGRRKYILFRPGYYLCRVPIIVSSEAGPRNPG